MQQAAQVSVHSYNNPSGHCHQDARPSMGPGGGGGVSPTVWAVLPGGLRGLWLPAQEVAQGGSPAAQGVVRRHEPGKQAQRGHCKTNRDSTMPPIWRAPSRRVAAPGMAWARLTSQHSSRTHRWHRVWKQHSPFSPCTHAEHSSDPWRAAPGLPPSVSPAEVHASGTRTT